MGDTVVQRLGLSPHSRKFMVSNQQGPSSVELHVLCMFVWFFLHNPKTCRTTGDTKLPVSMKMSMNGCSSLCVSSVMNSQPVEAVPRLSTIVGWD